MDIQRLLSDFLGSQSQGGRGRDHDGDSRRASSSSSSGGSLMDQVGGMLQGRGGSMVSSAVVGGLASQLFKKKGGKGLAGTALKLGGTALVAGLAYKAYQNYQAKAGATALPGAQPTRALASNQNADDIPEPRGTAFMPEGEEDERARLMLSAMIAAAKADGYIDADEERAIFGKIDDIDLDADEKGLVMDELRRPKSVGELAAAAHTPEIAMEIYTASVMAIDADHPAERAYLDLLAARLDLPADLATEIRNTAS